MWPVSQWVTAPCASSPARWTTEFTATSAPARAASRSQLTRAPMTRAPRCFLLLTACLALAGCWNNLPKTIRVSGRVTFDGQPPPAIGTVYFLPIEAGEGFPSRPATGDFGADGQFRATTFERGDGLMPGKYLMSIECWDSPPSMSGNPGKSAVPKKYQSPQTSGFKLDITPTSKPQQITLDVATR